MLAAKENHSGIYSYEYAGDSGGVSCTLMVCPTETHSRLAVFSDWPECGGTELEYSVSATPSQTGFRALWLQTLLDVEVPQWRLKWAYDTAFPDRLGPR